MPFEDDDLIQFMLTGQTEDTSACVEDVYVEQEALNVEVSVEELVKPKRKPRKGKELSMEELQEFVNSLDFESVRKVAVDKDEVQRASTPEMDRTRLEKKERKREKKERRKERDIQTTVEDRTRKDVRAKRERVPLKGDNGMTISNGLDGQHSSLEADIREEERLLRELKMELAKDVKGGNARGVRARKGKAESGESREPKSGEKAGERSKKKSKGEPKDTPQPKEMPQKKDKPKAKDKPKVKDTPQPKDTPQTKKKAKAKQTKKQKQDQPKEQNSQPLPAEKLPSKDKPKKSKKKTPVLLDFSKPDE